MNNYIIAIALTVFSTIIGSFGTLLLKKGSVKVTKNLSSFFYNKLLIFGALLYVGAVVFYIIGLKWVNVTVLYPITSTAYIWITLLSIKFLKEKINTYKWLGIAFIIFGVVMITK